MKLFGIFVVVCLVCELNALPSPLQAFTGGDQTTGSKWPPFQNAGLDYWSLKAQNIDLGEHNVDDGKDIVKKGVEAEEQPQPVVQQEIEEPQLCFFLTDFRRELLLDFFRCTALQ